MMLDRNSLKSEFSLIRSIYEQEGITDLLTIIENTAFFMLCKHLGTWQTLGNEVVNTIREASPERRVERFNFALSPEIILQKYSLPIRDTEIEQLLPNPPERLSSAAVEKLMSLGENLFADQSLSELFNRMLLFQFDDIQTGGRYPTPRHLTDWAASIIDISPNSSLADFACGSGGFLVAGSGKKQKMTGIEISPNWARLAFTNCLLHDLSPRIQIGNALTELGRKISDSVFDVILMNPPFGAKVDESLVAFAFDFKLSGRSETVLTSLALNHLAENGQMVVFLPSGSLFANSSGEQILREILIENGWLSAVISLPKDALQPYSPVATHVVLIEKKQEPDLIDWFFRPRYDGFTSGRNRQPEPEHNDLPLIQAALHERARVKNYWANSESTRMMWGEAITRGDEMVLGYRITSRNPRSFQVGKLSMPFVNSVPLFLTEAHQGDSAEWMLLSRTENRYGEKEDTIPEIKTPMTLEVNIKVDFLEEWDFDLQLTPQGVKYHEHLTNKTSFHTFINELDFTRTIGVLIDADGAPLTPAFTLPKAFEQSDAYIYYWMEETDDHSGALLTIPSKPMDSLLINDNQGRATHLIRFNDKSILGVVFDEKQTPHFTVFEVTNIRLGDIPILGSVIDPEGAAIGVAVPNETVQKSKNLDLQPSSYFQQESEMGAEVLDSPAQILANMQQSQSVLSSHIQKLLNLAELKPVATEEIPPRVAVLNPIGRMQGIQKDVWDSIQTKMELHQGETIPVPFQLEDLDLPYGLPDLERTIGLFERMGVVIKVSIKGTPSYRLVSARETETGAQR